eukprot:14562422-Heterocapsa_arctica.AAC.1
MHPGGEQMDKARPSRRSADLGLALPPSILTCISEVASEIRRCRRGHGHAAHIGPRFISCYRGALPCCSQVLARRGHALVIDGPGASARTSQVSYCMVDAASAG